MLQACAAAGPYAQAARPPRTSPPPPPQFPSSFPRVMTVNRDDAFAPDAVRRAQRGDERARSRLFSAAEPLLRGYFIKRIGRGPDVDDLIQNTLVRLHEGLGDLQKPGSLKAFLMKAALYELQDYYRGRYGMKEHLYDPEVPLERTGGARLEGRLDEGVPAEERMDVERALSLLSDKARRIMELRAYGYRYKEIARMIDSTEAAVKMQVKRAFDKMRDALAALLMAILAGGGL